MDTDKRTYEISFLAKGEEAASAVIRHLNQSGAEITSEEQIEQTELAYPIKKHKSAYFGCVHFALPPGDIEALKGALKFEGGILRYTIVTPPFLKEENLQPRGPRPTQDTQEEKQASPEAVATNEDLEAKLEEISGSLEQET